MKPHRLSMTYNLCLAYGALMGAGRAGGGGGAWGGGVLRSCFERRPRCAAGRIRGCPAWADGVALFSFWRGGARFSFTNGLPPLFALLSVFHLVPATRLPYCPSPPFPAAPAHGAFPGPRPLPRNGAFCDARWSTRWGGAPLVTAPDLSIPWPPLPLSQHETWLPPALLLIHFLHVCVSDCMCFDTAFNPRRFFSPLYPLVVHSRTPSRRVSWPAVS